MTRQVCGDSPADTPALGNGVALRRCVPKRSLGTRGELLRLVRSQG